MAAVFKKYTVLSLLGLLLVVQAESAKTDVLREKAASGDAESAFYLGNEYFYGENRIRNYTLAAYWYKKAAEKGIPEAQYNYGSCLESGRGVTKKLDDAFAWYRKAADQDFNPASYRIALFYLSGIPGEKGKLILHPDPKTALEMLEKLVRKQFEPAELELAAMKMGRSSPAYDQAEAFALLKRVTVRKNCSPKALRMLADCYFSGLGCPQDRAKAVELLKQAAAQGEPEALAKLGFLHEYGQGVKADPALANGYYRKAAEAGHPMAQFKYAEAMSEGMFPGKNFRDALPWYRKSAAAGCTQAIFKLGVFYYDGLGVKKDLRQAAKFFFQAARQGYVRAQYNLACLFETGEVTGKADPEAAFYWFQQAARGGDVTAQRRTGECYLNGTGVDRSVSNAEKWLLQAAQNGDFTARELLYRIQRSSSGSLY